MLIHDDNNLSQDVLEYLSFYLCFCYQRATKPVSIPTPIYYAHHLATRARVLTETISDSMSTFSGQSNEQEVELPDRYKVLHYFL